MEVVNQNGKMNINHEKSANTKDNTFGEERNFQHSKQSTCYKQCTRKRKSNGMTQGSVNITKRPGEGWRCVVKNEDVAERVTEAVCSWMKVESRIDMYATREDRIKSVAEQASHSTGFFSVFPSYMISVRTLFHHRTCIANSSIGLCAHRFG